MSISEYFDEESKKVCFKIQIVRKGPGGRIIVRRRADSIATMAEAVKTEKKLIAEAERELFAKEAKGASWEILVDEYEMALRNNNIFVRKVGPSSQREYIDLLRNYTHEWYNLRIEDIDRAKAWIILDRTEREVSVSRRERLYTAISGLYSWGILSGRIKSNSVCPVEGYRSRSKKEDKIPEILSLAEIRTLLKVARDTKHEWYPIWALALYTGMRSGELHALEWSKVDFENQMIYVHQAWTNKTGVGPTKGRYWRAVPMGDDLVKFMKELKLKTGNQKEVLPRFYQWDDGRQAEILRKFLEGHGLPSIKFHTLRACFGTQLIKDGVAPAIVMKMAGWKDLKTMQRYIRLAGVEVKGATNGLKLLPEEEITGTVIKLFS